MTLETTRRRVAPVSWFQRLVLGLGFPASIVAALCSTVYLAATLAHLLVDYRPDPQQAVLLGWVAVAAAALGALSIGAMLYRWWLILRRRRDFRLHEELTDQLLNLPDYAQDALQQLPQRVANAGVVSAGSQAGAAAIIQPIAAAVVAATLAPAIVLGGAPTLAPAQAAAVSPVATATATATARPIPTATASARPTATATAQPLTPYSATRLGPCDAGGAYWLNWLATATTTFPSPDYACLPNSLKLTYLTSENRLPTETQLAFVDKATYASVTGATPADQPSLRVLQSCRIDLDVSSLSASSTFGIFFLGGYAFSIDTSGNWVTLIPGANGSTQTDKSGTRTGASTFHLRVTRQNGVITYAIDGATVTTSQVDSNPYQGFLLTIGYGDSSVQLANLVYTPLP